LRRSTATMQLNTVRSLQRSYDLDSFTNKDTSAIHVNLMSWKLQ